MGWCEAIEAMAKTEETIKVTQIPSCELAEKCSKIDVLTIITYLW